MRLFFVALIFAGCASTGATTAPKGPLSTAMIELAQARCPAGTCPCREVGENGRAPKGVPERDVADGTKRFELRVGYGPDLSDVQIGKLAAIMKTGDNVAAQCAYVDLPAGRHKIKLRASAADARAGFHPVLLVNEYGVRHADWYDTFHFKCGASGPCSEGEMKDWHKKTTSVARGIHDPCGSVRIEGLKWSSDRASGEHLEDLTVELVLNVYPFEPRFPYGSSSCGKGSGSRLSDE